MRRYEYDTVHLCMYVIWDVVAGQHHKHGRFHASRSLQCVRASWDQKVSVLWTFFDSIKLIALSVKENPYLL